MPKINTQVSRKSEKATLKTALGRLIVIVTVRSRNAARPALGFSGLSCSGVCVILYSSASNLAAWSHAVRSADAEKLQSIRDDTAHGAQQGKARERQVVVPGAEYLVCRVIAV